MKKNILYLLFISFALFIFYGCGPGDSLAPTNSSTSDTPPAMTDSWQTGSYTVKGGVQ